MNALNLKLIRDLLAMKSQAVAIGLVVASGVALYVMSANTARSLRESQQAYYDHARFADVFASLKRAPKTLAHQVAAIPGVARVQTRVVEAVTLDVPGLAEPATGRLVSVPERGRPVLNDIHLRRGRDIEPNRPGEVLVNEGFATANGLQPGDTVGAVINGRRQDLRIVGIAMSPECIMVVAPGDMFPDDEHYGVFWMGERELASVFDLEGAFNDLNLTLMPGASVAEVIRRLDRLLAPYGGAGAYGRKEQVSNTYLSDEITGVETMARISPMIFLGVAAFLLNIVLARVITAQRQQIAVLKAFGYDRWEVGFHFMKLALFIAVGGAVTGGAFGLWMGRGMTNLYASFYRFPTGYYPDFTVMLTGFLLSVAAASLGVLNAVQRAVRLPAAEAMRPEPPAAFRATLIERIGLQRWFSSSARMTMRNLERKPWAAALSISGIALAAAILMVGNFGQDSVNYMMEFQFEKSLRADMTVALVEASSGRALQNIRHLPGVMHAEPYRSLSVRLRAGHRSRRVGIMGLEGGGDLYHLLNVKEEQVALPPEGLLLSDKLAELLDVGAGDRVTVEVLEGARPVRQMPVAGIVTEFAGVTAYMQLSALNRLSREGNSLSGAFLAVDPDQQDALFASLKATPRVAGVSVKEAAIASFRKTMQSSMLQMRLFMIFFSCIIAFGVVYNSARISLAERSRELATLRIIGFTRAEISMILLGEIVVITLLAIPLGLAMGYGLMQLMAQAMNTELYRIPVVISRSSYVFSAGVVMVATLVSSLIVRRKLDHLDLVSVLKAAQ
ncbi:MAG: FtsX-like permease family protein [Kiritimatiellia bacterium]|jgi:putative ABC transport system permease protein|nr:FtsX-like permease family protein [Kiritimatiellia bacterium]